MMINKRLIGTVGESKKYIAGNVVCQWISLGANIAMMISVTTFLAKLFEKTADKKDIGITVAVAMIAVVIRFICSVLSSRMSYLSSKAVKRSLREMIYKKLLRLGTSYNEKVKTSEVVQVAVEGVDQLETYFGAYLPQFFYAMLAPLTLFVVLCFVNVPCAVVLLICVPLIPVANVTASDNIYVMDKGCIVERGSHEVLLAAGKTYAKLWNAQAELENYGKAGGR